jgi:hypothetical protein
MPKKTTLNDLNQDLLTKIFEFNPNAIPKFICLNKTFSNKVKTSHYALKLNAERLQLQKKQKEDEIANLNNVKTIIINFVRLLHHNIYYLFLFNTGTFIPLLLISGVVDYGLNTRKMHIENELKQISKEILINQDIHANLSKKTSLRFFDLNTNQNKPSEIVIDIEDIEEDNEQKIKSFTDSFF